MARIIKDARIFEDDWVQLPPGLVAPEAALPAGKLLLPLLVWESRREELLARGTPLGIWLTGDEHPERIRDDVHGLQLIAIDFPVFTDGRGYSSARILRDQYGYRGELRATGDVLRDQLFLMRRCGFDSFALRADRDPEDALTAFGDFSHVYQQATVNPSPPLLLRAGAAQKH